MRRKTKKSPTAYRRRKRVGAISKTTLVDTVAAPIIGAIAGQLLASKLFAKQSETIKAAIPTGLGVFLVSMGNKPFIKGIGAGMIATGGAALATSLSGNLTQKIAGLLPSSDAISGTLPAMDAVSGTENNFSKFATLEAATF